MSQCGWGTDSCQGKDQFHFTVGPAVWKYGQGHPLRFRRGFIPAQEADLTTVEDEA
jgi:hypothetical protein